MDVLTFADGLDDLADVFAVFDDGVADLHIDQGDFVADGDVGERGDGEFAVVFCGYTEHVGAALQAFDDDDGDVVFGVVREHVGGLWHCCVLSMLVIDLAGA